MGRQSTRRITLAALALSSILLASPLLAADTSSRYQNAKAELDKGEFDLAIGQFRELQKDEPDSPYATQAQLEIAYAYYRMGDSEQVVASLKDFQQQNPEHPHIAYSHYLAGLSLYENAIQLIDNSSTREGRIRAKVSAQQALTYFSRLVNSYPKSNYASDARVKTTQLLEKLVLNQMENQASAQPAPAAVMPKASVVRDNEWLLTQTGGQYTLQLMSSPNRNDVYRVIAEHNLAEHSAVQHSKNSSGDSYNLLYGIYPSKSLAMEVGAGLPKAILDTRPWVREINAVQTEIRQQKIDATKHELASKTAAKTNTPATQQTETTTRIASTKPSLTKQQDASDWLLQQPASHLAIQLAGVTDATRVEEFFAHHALGAELRYFQALRKDKPWYSLIYGNFDNKEAALKALAEVKQKTGIEGAWLRSYRHIQEAIRSAQAQDKP